MPENTAAREAKNRVVSRLNELVGMGFAQNGRRKDWLVSRDGGVSVFLTYSKYHQIQKGHFYDISVKDLLEWADYGKALIIFLLGSGDRTVVFPIRDLFKMIKANGGARIAEDGTVKIHIDRRDGGFVLREAGNESLSSNLDRFDLISGDTSVERS
jgi:hypothetical protein